MSETPWLETISTNLALAGRDARREKRDALVQHALGCIGGRKREKS
jgi:hypothetical protein